MSSVQTSSSLRRIAFLLEGTLKTHFVRQTYLSLEIRQPFGFFLNQSRLHLYHGRHSVPLASLAKLREHRASDAYLFSTLDVCSFSGPPTSSEPFARSQTPSSHIACLELLIFSSSIQQTDLWLRYHKGFQVLVSYYNN